MKEECGGGREMEVVSDEGGVVGDIGNWGRTTVR